MSSMQRYYMLKLVYDITKLVYDITIFYNDFITFTLLCINIDNCWYKEDFLQHHIKKDTMYNYLIVLLLFELL